VPKVIASWASPDPGLDWELSINNLPQVIWSWVQAQGWVRNLSDVANLSCSRDFLGYERTKTAAAPREAAKTRGGDSMYEFPIVAVTNFPKQRGLRQHKCIMLLSWRSEVQSDYTWLPPGCWWGWFSLKALSRMTSLPFPESRKHPPSLACGALLWALSQQHSLFQSILPLAVTLLFPSAHLRDPCVRVPMLKPLLLATWEAEIERIMVQGQPQ
jgi:hypothetical protein